MLEILCAEMRNSEVMPPITTEAGGVKRLSLSHRTAELGQLINTLRVYLTRLTSTFEKFEFQDPFISGRPHSEYHREKCQ